MRAVFISICIFVVLLTGYLIYSAVPPTPHTIGFLQFTSNNARTMEGFKEGMADLGYVEGTTINYLYDGPASTTSELRPLMEKLAAQKPDLVFASTTPAAKVAASICVPLGIPVVFGPVNDPVASGIVATPSRPESIITGIRLAPTEARRLESLHEVAPEVRTVLVPYNPKDDSALVSLNQLKAVADHLQVQTIFKKFSPQSNPQQDTTYVPDNIDAIFLPREALVMSRLHQFLDVAFRRQLPVSSARLDQVQKGAVTGYGFSGYELGKQAAQLASKILSGTNVADLPVETAQDYLYINMHSAKQIHLNISEKVLRRAHTIFYNGDSPS